MRRDIIRSSISVRDVIEIADYIAANNLDAGLQFLDAAEETYAYLAANHEAGQLCDFGKPDVEDLRIWRIDGYRNYLVFFRQTIDSVIIERVLHGARDAKALLDKNG